MIIWKIFFCHLRQCSGDNPNSLFRNYSWKSVCNIWDGRNGAQVSLAQGKCFGLLQITLGSDAYKSNTLVAVLWFHPQSILSWKWVQVAYNVTLNSRCLSCLGTYKKKLSVEFENPLFLCNLIVIYYFMIKKFQIYFKSFE